jgi:hypothetical protein
MGVSKIEITNTSTQPQKIVEAGVSVAPGQSYDLLSGFSLKEISNFFSLQRMIDDKTASCKIVRDGESMFFSDADNFQSVLLEARIQEVDTTLVDFPSVVSGSLIIDAGAGSLFSILLTTDVLVGDPLNPRDGQKIILRLKQDAIGGHSISFSSAWNFGVDLSGILFSTAGEITDYIGAIYNEDAAKWDVISITRGY